MSRALYHGKIVLTMEHERIKALPAQKISFHPKRGDLITGGASGFGLALGRFMVDRGARFLILLSRSGCKSNADQIAVDAMKAEGTEILMVSADIAD